MVRHLSASLVAMTVTAMWLVATAAPVAAACHIAGFVEVEVEAAEATGVVSLVVELQGGVGSCAGTVDVTTVDGTATAGEDYEAVTRTLTFEENDDRVETVDVTILADDEADGGETFTLELSNPTGGISGTGGPATVTITDDAEGDASGDGADATEGETGDADTGDDVQDAPDTGVEDDGLSFGIIVGVAVAIAIGIGAFVLLRGRA